MISEKLEISRAIKPFISSSYKSDIYSGNENISFKNRHPIFKALLRIEFEDAIKEYLNL